MGAEQSASLQLCCPLAGTDPPDGVEIGADRGVMDARTPLGWTASSLYRGVVNASAGCVRLAVS
jgi:hypothetical protein